MRPRSPPPRRTTTARPAPAPRGTERGSSSVADLAFLRSALIGRRRDPRLAIAALGVVLAAAGVAAGMAAAGPPHAPDVPSAWPLVALTLCLTVAGALCLKVTSGREADRLDLFEAALLPAVALVPGGVLVALVVLSKAVSQLVLRLPAGKAAFNLAQW